MSESDLFGEPDSEPLPKEVQRALKRFGVARVVAAMGVAAILAPCFRPLRDVGGNDSLGAACRILFGSKFTNTARRYLVALAGIREQGLLASIPVPMRPPAADVARWRMFYARQFLANHRPVEKLLLRIIREEGRN